MVLLHIIANECGFLLIQTITLLMFFTTSVSLHFLPFAAEKLEKDDQKKKDAYWQRQHRNKTQGENKIHSFLFPSFVNNQKKNGRRPRMLSFIQILDLISERKFRGGGGGRATVLGLKKYTGKFSQ